MADDPSGWRADLALRLKRHFAIKVVGVTAYTWLFFIGYFSLLRDPAFPTLVMPLTVLDHLVPFQPAMIFAYLSLWVYVGVAPGLQLRLEELVSYGVWVGLLCGAGLAIFYFFPTSIPPVRVDAHGFPGFALLQGVDAPGNACPSMHVAVAVFSAIWVDIMLAEARAPAALRVLNGLWFAAIAWSTVAIRQHVVLDAVAGAALGIAFALASIACRPARIARTFGGRRRKGPEPSAIIGGSGHEMKRNAAT